MENLIYSTDTCSTKRAFTVSHSLKTKKLKGSKLAQMSCMTLDTCGDMWKKSDHSLYTF